MYARVCKGWVVSMMRKSVAPRCGLVHELVPWWLFCYYFMHSLEERFCFVAAPRECTPEQNIFLLSMLSVEIRFS